MLVVFDLDGKLKGFQTLGTSSHPVKMFFLFDTSKSKNGLS